MRPLGILGLLLILLGIAGLVAGRFNYTTESKIVDVGPLQAVAKEHHTVDIPDIAGVVAVLAGGFLVYVGRRRA
jgi:hypothetical protein